jgi:hypothetical protein
MSNDATKQLAAMANNAGIAVVVDEDAMPVVKLEGDLNVTGRRLGEIVARLDLFCLNGEFVFFDHKGQQQVMTDFRFRTWINDFVITATNFDKKDGAPIPLTMDKVAAATILMCENFRRGVRELAGINHVRCPVIREDGTLELLPWGYDEQTMIYTVPGGLEYGDDLDWAAAKGRLAREFGTFPITDDRSMAVQVAAMANALAKATSSNFSKLAAAAAAPVATLPVSSVATVVVCHALGDCKTGSPPPRSLAKTVSAESPFGPELLDLLPVIQFHKPPSKPPPPPQPA